MKHFNKLVVFIALLTISTGMHAQLLTATPSKLSFASTVGTQVQQQTTMKVAGLSGGAVLTGFTLSVIGPNADQFSAQNTTTSLLALLQQLLSGTGSPILVNYKPTTAGIHTAKVVVNANVLGLTLLTDTIPVTGMTFTTTPVPGSTIRLQEPGDPFEIKITFADNAQVDNSGNIFSNPTGYVGSLTEGVERGVIILDASALNITGGGLTFGMTIPSGYITDGTNTPLNAISLNYQVDPRPYLVSVNPVPGTIMSNTGNFSRTFSFTFNKAMAIGTTPPVVKSGSSFMNINSYSVTGNTLNVVVTGSVTARETFTLTIPFGYLVDASPYILPYEGGNWTYTIQRTTAKIGVTPTGDDMLKEIVSETFYTIMGIQVSQDALQPGTIYLKKTVYDDGSQNTIKFIQSRK